VYRSDVDAAPFVNLFGELFRRGHTFAEIGRVCGFTTRTAQTIADAEVSTVRRRTAHKALRALDLLPPEEWLHAFTFSPSEKRVYATREWLGESA
jgi:hypothetical protein